MIDYQQVPSGLRNALKELVEVHKVVGEKDFYLPPDASDSLIVLDLSGPAASAEWLSDTYPGSDVERVPGSGFVFFWPNGKPEDPYYEESAVRR
tara:strand:- start:2263 stop:2544 length:282 start_codon:yes stop_codon:yes gene_type:complete